MRCSNNPFMSLMPNIPIMTHHFDDFIIEQGFQEKLWPLKKQKLKHVEEEEDKVCTEDITSITITITITYSEPKKSLSHRHILFHSKVSSSFFLIP